MKRHLFLIIFFVFLFMQTGESKEYNKMFLFEYKILRASEISKLFEEKGNGVVFYTKFLAIKCWGMFIFERFIKDCFGKSNSRKRNGKVA